MEKLVSKEEKILKQEKKLNEHYEVAIKNHPEFTNIFKCIMDDLSNWLIEETGDFIDPYGSVFDTGFSLESLMSGKFINIFEYAIYNIERSYDNDTKYPPHYTKTELEEIDKILEKASIFHREHETEDEETKLDNFLQDLSMVEGDIC